MYTLIKKNVSFPAPTIPCSPCWFSALRRLGFIFVAAQLRGERQRCIPRPQTTDNKREHKIYNDILI